MITHVCAWCGKELDFENTADRESRQESQQISHGICLDCRNNIFQKKDESLQEFLNRIEAPVFVFNEKNSIIAANKQALETTNINISENYNIFPGDIFECINAEIPEACGSSSHCNGCVLRRTILNTHTTGIPHFQTEIHIDSVKKGKLVMETYFISTEKAASFVILRIDKKKTA